MLIILSNFFFKWIDPVLTFRLFLQSICIFPFMFFKTFFQSSFIRQNGEFSFTRRIVHLLFFFFLNLKKNRGSIILLFLHLYKKFFASLLIDPTIQDFKNPVKS